MASFRSLGTLSFLVFLAIQLLSSISQAIVPPENQFTYVNDDRYGDYIVEYGADYRVTQLAQDPFQVCFYNTTPNAFTLALRMGTSRSESLRRWVWEANRGNPVRDNATFSLGSDGNLVLADADGRVAWQTNTANKGVTGFMLLGNGNMVLHDSKGKYVWQSFDYPTDNLLVGQSLRVGATTKLVSRASEKDNSNGPYSLVLEHKGFSMYYKSRNSPKPMLYFQSSDLFSIDKGSMVDLTFNSFPEENTRISYLGFQYSSINPENGGGRNMVRSSYNSTMSYLRLGIDGNIRFFTYDMEADNSAWQISYTLFSRDSDYSECQLPSRCGMYGLCEEDQCVACPSPNGLLGWSNKCAPPMMTSCKASDFHYYKVEGVDHFMSKYTKGDGPMKEIECERKCTKDCKCRAYFYRKDSSRCWIAYDLKTLTRVGNSKHRAFIKAPNHLGFIF